MRKASRILLPLLLLAILGFPSAAPAKEAVQNWELVNPEGVLAIQPIKINPHPATLEGKTVALRWNSKQNGENFLNRVAELLLEKVKDVKVVKIYEKEPWTNVIGGPPFMTADEAKKIAAKIKEYKPDLVIASQAD